MIFSDIFQEFQEFLKKYLQALLQELERRFNKKNPFRILSEVYRRILSETSSSTSAEIFPETFSVV